MLKALALCFLLTSGALAQAAERAQPPPPKKAVQEQQQQAQANNAAAAAAGAGAAIVATQPDMLSSEDPFAFPAPTPRARQWLGYVSPRALLFLAPVLTALAAPVGEVVPPQRRRLKRGT